MPKEATPPGTCEVTDKIHPRRWRAAVILWALFGLGLIVQLFAPRLRIENGAFVMPGVLTSGSPPATPAQIVARERMMQTLSAVLTLSGALGLAYHYRGRITRPS